jgi:hypothetical protein
MVVSFGTGRIPSFAFSESNISDGGSCCDTNATYGGAQ